MFRAFLDRTLRRRGNLPPMPVVGGAGRSGTTLLRLMLDAHPEVAVPPEFEALAGPPLRQLGHAYGHRPLNR